MRNFFIKNIALPFVDYSKNQMVSKYYNLFSSLSEKDSKDIVDYQNKKIQDLVNHAYNNTKYYNELFNYNKIKPSEIQSKEDLQRIPPLTREILQTRYDDLIDKKNKYKKIYKGSSSGSTGQAVFYLHDEYGSSAGIAAHYLGWHLAGYRFGDKGLHIWGNPAVVKNVWNKPSSKLKSWLFNHFKFPAYRLTEESSFGELVDLLVKKKFDFIDGYTNAIFLLADYLDKNNITLKAIKYVLTTAENLHDYQKELIEKRIGPVFDEFGCGEIMGIAYQNKFNNQYAIIDPHVAVEFETMTKTDDGSHPLIITDLDNRIMPLIRYKNGDMGTQSPHFEDTNLPLSTMSTVSGRTSDIIELPKGGRLVVPSFFGSVLLKEINSIRQYQIEKVASDKLIIKLVVKEQLSTKDELTLKNALDEYLAGQISYEIKVVDYIAVSPNGKFKLLVDKTKS